MFINWIYINLVLNWYHSGNWKISYKSIRSESYIFFKLEINYDRNKTSSDFYFFRLKYKIIISSKYLRIGHQISVEIILKLIIIDQKCSVPFANMFVKFALKTGFSIFSKNLSVYCIGSIDQSHQKIKIETHTQYPSREWVRFLQKVRKML